MTAAEDELDDELDSEREHVAAARAALVRMLDDARRLVELGQYAAGDPYSLERLGRMVKSHAKELADEPEGPVFFGRLDFGPGAAAGQHAGRRYYLGRRHITDDAGDPMVIDWRAGAARAFYRARAADPMGVAVRRRFGWAPPPGGPPGAAAVRLTGFEDEHLDRGQDLDGRSAILDEEIERPRRGPMRDIVATIQPDQDELVRADLAESICVQGSPGTGKTAVGLHRAAYLLYQHRGRLERAGLLILGPNPTFLRYISAVLPALGEVGVEQTTVDRLVAAGRRPAAGTDGPAAAAVKHDARMAEVIRRALYGRVAKPAAGLEVPDGSHRWRLPPHELRPVVEAARRSAVPYGIARERVRAQVVELLQRQAERRGQSPDGAWRRRIGREPAVAGFVDAVWPRARPDELVAELLGDPAALARAAGGRLTDQERAAIRWPRPRRASGAPWSAADLLLIDEAAGLIDHLPGYGHVIVDEAQDLSPMQCRAIARRSAHGSLTVLGDLAQGTAPWAARNWPDQLVHLGKPAATLLPLTAGFRVPAAVLELANRLLAAFDTDVPAARSLRRDGELHIRETPDLPAEVVAAVRAALAEDGSIGVLAADSDIPALESALRAAGLDDPARVAVLPATLSHGLEYDHVVVAEPAAIADAEPRGLNRLYVVLTRAVSRLDVLHTRPLPPPLTT